LVLRTASSS